MTDYYDEVEKIREYVLDGMDIFTAIDAWADESCNNYNRKRVSKIIEKLYFKLYGYNGDEVHDSGRTIYEE